MRHFNLLARSIASIFMLSAWLAAPPALASNLLEQEEQRLGELLQDTHAEASRTVLDLANSIDSIFGDRRTTDDINRTTLRISRVDRMVERSTSSGDLNIDLDLKLPVFERRQSEALDKFVISSDRGSDGPSSAEQTREGRISGDGFLTDQRERLERLGRQWNYHAGPGVTVGQQIGYRLRGRISRSFLVASFAHHFSEEVTWSNTDYWSARTLLYSDYAIADRVLFRFINDANAAISNRRLNSSHGPSLIRQFDAKSGASLDLRADLSTLDQSFGLRGYTFGVTYHRKLVQQWLRIELTPGLSFPTANNLQGEWFISTKLELIIGQI